MKLPDHILAMLKDDGCTPRYLCERLDIRHNQATALLREAGAINSGGRYRIPSLERRQRAMNHVCFPSDHNGADFTAARDGG